MSASTANIELFLLKCAPLKIAVEESIPRNSLAQQSLLVEHSLKDSVSQFSSDVRENAEGMAEFYKLFYMLENDIRNLIDDTLTEAHGVGWWQKYAPPNVQEECRLSQQREAELGVTSRSDRELEYITFGQLGDLIKANYDRFGGIISNQKALTRVMAALNNLRGPIAHCGVLADDEIDRLKLTVKDWFRLLEGPKSH